MMAMHNQYHKPGRSFCHHATGLSDGGPRGANCAAALHRQTRCTGQESLWWFNFIQIPPINKDAQNDNQLLVLVRSRVKYWSDPQGWWVRRWRWRTPAGSGCRMASCIYAITVVSILLSRHLTSAVREKQRIQSETIAPWATMSWPAKISQVNDAQMRWINDQGASLSGRVALEKQDNVRN